MAIKLSTMINTKAVFLHSLFIDNYRRMTITFYGPDAAGMKSFMCLDQGVNSFLSLYNNIVVLSSWLLMVIILLNYFIKETFSDLLSSNHGRWDTDLVGWSYFSQDFCVCSHEKMKIN